MDLFALGGSGPGTFHPLRLQIPSGLGGWAEKFLKGWGTPRFWIGVQIGASDPMKAWRPASYGHMMAILGAAVPVGFVLIVLPTASHKGGVQTPVVNISVGHVDFRETGPYGPGHWVIQPDISCGPCGFDMVCPHHACKDHIDARHVAELCRYVLAQKAFPSFSQRMRVYDV